VIIYKFTQGNLGAKKNRQQLISVASQEKKIANCDIGIKDSIQPYIPPKMYLHQNEMHLEVVENYCN
jgi:hypothetical protein